MRHGNVTVILVAVVPCASPAHRARVALPRLLRAGRGIHCRRYQARIAHARAPGPGQPEVPVDRPGGWRPRGSRERRPGKARRLLRGDGLGGVWKSSDGGYTWAAVSDDYPIASTGAIAVAPSDPNVVYVGAGEANIRGNVAAGNGIFKSLDGGKTWTHVWQQEGQIGTMVVHRPMPTSRTPPCSATRSAPTRSEALSHPRWRTHLAAGPRQGRRHGGLGSGPRPTNPNVVFAGLWQARRQPWSLTSGGPGGGLYVSRDAGDTWVQLSGSGLPAPPWGKVGVAVAPSDGRRVYALIEATDGGLFRSDDGGRTWTRANGHRALRQRAWYYSTLTVNPANPNEVWFPQVTMYRSIDGGATIQPVRTKGGWDHHDVWNRPAGSEAHDRRQRCRGDPLGRRRRDLAGAAPAARDPILPRGGRHARAVPGGRHAAGPRHRAGAEQQPRRGRHRRGRLVPGGRRRGRPHPVRSGRREVVYAGEYLGYISRYDTARGRRRTISACPTTLWLAAARCAIASSGGADCHVSATTMPCSINAAQVLFRSSDGGKSWTAISPDLTRNDLPGSSGLAARRRNCHGDNTASKPTARSSRWPNRRSKGRDLGGQRTMGWCTSRGTAASRGAT